MSLYWGFIGRHCWYLELSQPLLQRYFRGANVLFGETENKDSPPHLLVFIGDMNSILAQTAQTQKKYKSACVAEYNCNPEQLWQELVPRSDSFFIQAGSWSGKEKC